MIDHTGEEITQVFRESWNKYQKVVHMNHLNHREIIEAFGQELETFGNSNAKKIVKIKGDTNVAEEHKRGIRVLDIGVGDGWLPSQLLTLPNKNIPEIDQFTGIDTTAEALAIAKTTAATTIPAKNQVWQQADMREYMQQCPSNTFDVIYSSYTIHHLDNSEERGKPALLRDIHRCLTPNSLFLWADVYNNIPKRSREDMMKAWYEERFSQYQGLTEVEKQEIWDHVNEFDMPEELEESKKMMTTAGFVDVKVCFDDGFYTLVLSGRKKED
jgi:ubiquinone/menaquinone biosynthesis C-methylase UbiE